MEMLFSNCHFKKVNTREYAKIDYSQKALESDLVKISIFTNWTKMDANVTKMDIIHQNN